MPRIEIVSERRRAHSAAFRARVVAESQVAGARVQDIAERHGLCPSLIYRWRRRDEPDEVNGGPMRLVPVRIAEAPGPPMPPPPSSPSRSAPTRRAGAIEIELGGDVRVRVGDDVSLVALRRVMAVLRG